LRCLWLCLLALTLLLVVGVDIGIVVGVEVGVEVGDGGLREHGAWASRDARNVSLKISRPLLWDAGVLSNPGPGLGILTAMLLFGPRAIRPTVPAAMVVQFLGGIHEIYFPYVLMKPILVIAAILGGASGVLWETIFNLGLRAPASPGSIFAWALESPPTEIALIMIGVVISAGVTFIFGALLLRFGRGESSVDASIDLEAAREQTAQNKKASKTAATAS